MNQIMVVKLRAIMLSEKAREGFFGAYKTDGEFRRWLTSLIPEVEASRLQAQNNPWHIYNVLEHTLVAVENMNRLTKHDSESERWMLSMVMFLHDLGKPECHVVKLDKHGKEKDSFYGHHLASERIAGRVLGELGFEPKQTELMKKLVHDHDYFMYLFGNPDFEKNKLLAYAQEKIAELSKWGDGHQLNAMLCKIGLADNMAQNPALTKQGIEWIKQYERLSHSLKPQVQNEKE